MRYASPRLHRCDGARDSSIGNEVIAIDAIAIVESEVDGFDKQREPVIKRWSVETTWIHLEARAPFFAEDAKGETGFENIPSQTERAPGVVVERDDRAALTMDQPNPGTVAQSKAWLERYRRNRGS